MSKGKFPVTSPSGLLDFEGCQKRWFLTKVQKLHKFQVTEAITHGNVTHDRLERHVKYDEVLPDHVVYLDPFFKYLRDTGYQLYAELECAVLEDWSVTNWWDKNCYLRGKVDLIAIKGTEAIVVDYKTGKRKPDPTQLKIYGLMAMSVLGLTKVTSYYLWTQTKESDAFEITTDTFDEIKSELNERIARIKTAYDTDNFPARTSPLCGWCPCLDTCEEASYYKAKRDRERR
jgi:hypothetical protein